MSPYVLKLNIDLFSHESISFINYHQFSMHALKSIYFLIYPIFNTDAVTFFTYLLHFLVIL